LIKRFLSGALQSPFTLFCIPLLVGLLQFILMVNLAKTGFPQVLEIHKTAAGFLITGIFALCFGTLIGSMLGLRQMIYGENKIISTLGTGFNALYFLGFVLFFICIFVTNSSY